ncbi:MAG: MerR family transcriptional regulator [Bacteroidales bacterium]
MALHKNKKLKLFYSISEVAALLGVNESLLRFWEREVDIFSIKKTAGGTRQYTKEDIELIRKFKHLVKEQGMTLPGAAAKLKANPQGVSKNFEIIDRLEAVKRELLAIKSEMLHWGDMVEDEEE